MYVGNHWGKCMKCGILTAHTGAVCHPGGGISGGPMCSTCGGSDGSPKEDLKQENEALKARILRLEERIAQLTTETK